MASGSLSVGGTCTIERLPPASAACMAGMVPVISLADISKAVGCGIATDAVASGAFGAEPFSDCLPIGVGEVIEGVAGSGTTGFALSSAGGGSLEFSIGGNCGALPPSSSVIAILKVPSTITTTLAPTSSERILEVIVEGSLSLLPVEPLSGLRAALSA